MFLGHYGLAFAAKRVAPGTSLGTLVFAAQFLDELWPILLLLGVEEVRIVPGLMRASPLDFVHYPISHSLLMAAGWGIVLGGVYYVTRRPAGRAALVVGALVVSHWFLDLPMHRPDLPLWPGASPLLGGGLWNSVILTAIIELTIFAAGVSLYLRGTRPLDRTGRWAPWTMIGLLLLIFLGSLTGEPPPSVRALALVTLGLWLFVPWAAWIDRHRAPRARRGAPAVV
jgi:hypothetical protein